MRTKRNYTIMVLILMQFAFLFISCAGYPRNADERKEMIIETCGILEVISDANTYYFTDHSKDAESVKLLEEQDYLMIDPYSKKIFDFSLQLENGKLMKIIATSTKKAPFENGKTIIYDMVTGEFYGSLIDKYPLK